MILSPLTGAVQPLPLRDMTVIADAVPAKLLKALAVIAEKLHPTMDAALNNPGKSKESCVLCSLAVRDFLRSIGFVDARVRPVQLVIRAVQAGRELHSLGIGAAGQKKREGYWCGHMIVMVPSARLLIDTTLYPALRPQWPDLPPMVAAPLGWPDNELIFDRMPIAGLQLDDAGRDYLCQAVWLDDPTNTRWRFGADARETWRRAPAISTMRARFGEWRET